MFIPHENDDINGILKEYHPQARVVNTALIEETWINSDVQIPTQEQYDLARESFFEKINQKAFQKTAFQNALDEGFEVKSGIIISVSDKSRANFNDLAIHLEREFKASNITLETLIDIPDKNGDERKISYSEFLGMLIPYGRLCRHVYKLNPENK